MEEIKVASGCGGNCKCNNKREHMVIGVPTSTSKTQYFTNTAYLKYIKEAGYIPMFIIPEMMDNSLTIHKSFLDLCDGLLLPGGIDVDPIYYREHNYSCMSSCPEKDEFERSLLHSFIRAGKPVFGICRGFQLIVREYLAITNTSDILFTQHISGHSLANDRGVRRNVHTHYVRANTDILYGNGEKTNPAFEGIPVNSMHHQGVLVSSHIVESKRYKKTGNIISAPKKVGNLKILSYTNFGVEKEKNVHLVEAVEIENWGDSLVRGVQWHPEELMDVKLLQNFYGNKDGEINGNNEGTHERYRSNNV